MTETLKRETTLTCEWCGADYRGDKLTPCRICEKTRAEQRYSLHLFNVKHGLDLPLEPTGRVFVIDGVRIPEVR